MYSITNEEGSKGMSINYLRLADNFDDSLNDVRSCSSWFHCNLSITFGKKCVFDGGFTAIVYSSESKGRYVSFGLFNGLTGDKEL